MKKFVIVFLLMSFFTIPSYAKKTKSVTINNESCKSRVFGLQGIHDFILVPTPCGATKYIGKGHEKTIHLADNCHPNLLKGKLTVTGTANQVQVYNYAKVTTKKEGRKCIGYIDDIGKQTGDDKMWDN